MTSTKLKQQPNIQLHKHVISDMVLVATDQLLLSIREQCKVILVNSESGQVLSEIVLQDTPGYICMTSASQAAATFLNKTIQFVQVNKTTLQTDSITNVDVNAYGIASYRNHLVVSYIHPSGVKTISKDGTTIHNLDNTTAGRDVFKLPRCIATTPDGSIYVTDWGTGEITRLDSSLTILQTFSGDMLNDPHGIISLNTDLLIVCSSYDYKVVLIRPSTNRMTVLLDKPSGKDKPRYLCFCKEQKKLYVAPQADKILVYKLSWLN